MKLSQQALSSILDEMIVWTRDRMHDIGSDLAVVGISGGKDSTVVAALAARAMGKENVLGVTMPRGVQKDLDVAQAVAASLGIRHHVVPIGDVADALARDVTKAVGDFSRQAALNLPPRLRMAALYAVAQTVGGVVWNTSNLSEDWVGYATIYGDTSGAFSPLATLTTDEVVQLGRFMEVEERFLVIPPADGLTGHTDEEVLGFTYDTLNTYIRTGECPQKEIKEKIDRLHRISRFKFQTIPMFQSGLPIRADDIAHIYCDA